jgi:hypothetical protein
MDSQPGTIPSGHFANMADRIEALEKARTPLPLPRSVLPEPIQLRSFDAPAETPPAVEQRLL